MPIFQEYRYVPPKPIDSEETLIAALKELKEIVMRQEQLAAGGIPHGSESALRDSKMQKTTLEQALQSIPTNEKDPRLYLESDFSGQRITIDYQAFQEQVRYWNQFRDGSCSSCNHRGRDVIEMDHTEYFCRTEQNKNKKPCPGYSAQRQNAQGQPARKFEEIIQSVLSESS